MNGQVNGQAPINSQLPNANQQMQPNGRPVPQQGVPRPVNQPPQNMPAPNGQQPNVSQPAAQQADPPPTAPSSPPVVSYRDGLLTVQALNASLSSVIAAIKSKTGIEFEGWENVPDRVALSLGPAPAGEVLSAIFSGSKFDFIAIGRPDSPSIVQRVILSPRKGPGTTAVAQQPPQPRPGQEGDDDDTPDETVNAVDPQDTSVQPPQPPPQAQAPPEPQQPKTPDQLLQELQEMQKQQQQQQQGVTPNPNQVPRKQPPL